MISIAQGEEVTFSAPAEEIVGVFRSRKMLTIGGMASWIGTPLAEHHRKQRRLVLKEDVVGVRLFAFDRSNANERSRSLRTQIYRCEIDRDGLSPDIRTGKQMG